MLIIVIPVFIISFTFIIRYRAGNKSADYKPNWGHSVLLETIWWGVPCSITIILGMMTWTMTHKLDPYQKINIPGSPLLIQVVALPWKWLFIYPKKISQRLIFWKFRGVVNSNFGLRMIMYQ